MNTPLNREAGTGVAAQAGPLAGSFVATPGKQRLTVRGAGAAVR